MSKEFSCYSFFCPYFLGVYDNGTNWRSSENPFDNGINDTPISTICRNIEIDILEMLDETNLPPKIEPFNDVLL
ncbi:MAG: hypothetical protein IPI52_00435 [Bacteroidetes bacterium]|nr:hypothetical protein [Bacteroidota bacterium]